MLPSNGKKSLVTAAIGASVLAMHGRAAPDPRPDPHVPLRHLSAAALGNALEFYDFLTYAYFAVHIAHAFFPSSTPGIALLESLATFGVGFLTRPLGGIVIGGLGDRIGRQPTMMMSFGLMGIAILGLALTPPASRIGGWAPVLAVSFRLLQGFALGGEVGPASAFLAEAAPIRWRGSVLSLQSGTQNVAILVSALIGLGLTRTLSPAALDLYGWRIAFGAGALVVPLGLWIRLSLPETLHRHEPSPPAPVTSRLVTLASLMMISVTVQTYVQAYLTTYAITSLHMGEGLAFGASLLGAVCGLVVGPLCAHISDRLQRRRPFVLWPALLRLITTLPIFWLMVKFHNAAALLGGTALFTVLGAASPTAVVVVESIPQRVRAGTFGLLYAVMISAFGGTTQFVIQGLIDLTHNPLAPAWYLTGALVLGLIAAALFPESAPGSAVIKREADGGAFASD